MSLGAISVPSEVAYANLDDVLTLAEDLVVEIIRQVLQHCSSELETLNRDMTLLKKIQTPFPRLTYDQAVSILRAKGSDIQWGSDLGGTDETLLAKQYDQPIMVHRYPSQVKAFYMEPDPIRPELALSADVLAPEGYGEIIGGGQRVSSLELLRQRINEHQLPIAPFQWYLDLRKYGTFPHSGFGMGIERVVAWICGIEHVRETIPFPRTIYRLTP